MPRGPGEKFNPKNKTINPDGSVQYHWADGTPLSKDEYAAEVKGAVQGQVPGKNDTPSSGQVPTGTPGPATKSEDPLNNTPLFKYFNDMVPKQVSDTAPGASLDTTNADAERNRTQSLLSQLQQQAATGDGEWENTLAQATQNAQQTASALGQSNPQSSYQSSLRNIGNAQSAASQRAVGQGNMLRAQAQQDALSQEGNLLNGMGEQDIEQSRLSAQARQQLRETNSQLLSDAQKQATSKIGGIGQMFSSWSKGGAVPGKAQVFGDDEKNDTVPAMLSPGEIVVPRSMSNDPDAAASFARAVAMNRGVKKMADGGSTGNDLQEMPGPTAGESALMVFAPHFGQHEYFSRMNPQQDASIDNGGLLDARNFDANRAQSQSLADALASRGPSVTGQQMTNASDDSVAGAMAQQQQRASAATALSQAVAQQQQAGGQSAATSGNEQSRRQRMLADTLNSQRGRDLAMALAQQQAGWRNTALNAGLSAASQAQVMNAISGGAQAIGALSKAASKNGDKEDPYSTENTDTPTDGQSGEMQGPAQQEPPGDYNPPSGDEGGQYAAHGGVILDSDEAERKKTASFLKALRRAA